jgi:hypothetical protein
MKNSVIYAYARAIHRNREWSERENNMFFFLLVIFYVKQRKRRKKSQTKSALSL